MAVSLKLLGYTWQLIGFRKDKLIYLAVGLGVGIFCFSIAYGAEYLILRQQELSPRFEWFVSGFSLTGEIVKQTGLFAFSLCVLLNIINVVMEEGIFRGLFIRLGMEKVSLAKANLYAAFLFGLWHISMPIKSLVDRQMDIITAAAMGLGYVVLAMIMGIKWGLWLSSTHCLWFGIAEHFFNNTITNMLHITTATASDELQIVRIIIAQMLSLAITLLIYKRFASKNKPQKKATTSR